jgi:hypothetical protein
VTALSMKDAELEACLSRNVQAWRFQKIGRSLPVTNSFQFGSDAW